MSMFQPAVKADIHDQFRRAFPNGLVLNGHNIADVLAEVGYEGFVGDRKDLFPVGGKHKLRLTYDDAEVIGETDDCDPGQIEHGASGRLVVDGAVLPDTEHRLNFWVDEDGNHVYPGEEQPWGEGLESVLPYGMLLRELMYQDVLAESSNLPKARG